MEVGARMADMTVEGICVLAVSVLVINCHGGCHVIFT